MTDRPRISEAEAERIADQRVQRRLGTDRAYRNAASAVQQSRREQQIELAVWRDLEAQYEIEGTPSRAPGLDTRGW